MATLPAQLDMGAMVTLAGAIGHHGGAKRSPSPGGIVAAKTPRMSNNKGRNMAGRRVGGQWRRWWTRLLLGERLGEAAAGITVVADTKGIAKVDYWFSCYVETGS